MLNGLTDCDCHRLIIMQHACTATNTLPLHYSISSVLFGIISAPAVFYSMKEAEASGRVALAGKLNDQMQKLEDQAAAFSIPNEFGATLSQAGAAGLNATTSHDATRYFMAMPADKLELWFALEAERFRVIHCASCQVLLMPV